MSDNSNTTPPGWYPDGQGGQRWWDGTQWAAPSAPPSSAPSNAPSGPPPSGPPAGTPAYGTPAAGATPAQPSYGAPAGGPAGSPQYGSQQYGAPQYGAPAGPAGGSKKGLFIILGVVAAVIIVFAVTAFAVPGFLKGSDGPSGSDPAKSVQAFFDAAKAEDCDAAKELVTDKLKSTFTTDDCTSTTTLPDGSELRPEDIEISVGDAKIDGENATVPVVEKLPGFGDITVDFLLVKQGGAWLIDDFRPQTPDLDGLPTDIPTDFPTDVPTDFPTDIPTDFPTDIPTDFFPTDIPSDFFSDFPSDFPTDFFSDFPTDFPTDFLTDFPTDFPTE